MCTNLKRTVSFERVNCQAVLSCALSLCTAYCSPDWVDYWSLRRGGKTEWPQECLRCACCHCLRLVPLTCQHHWHLHAVPSISQLRRHCSYTHSHSHLHSLHSQKDTRSYSAILATSNGQPQCLPTSAVGNLRTDLSSSKHWQIGTRHYLLTSLQVKTKSFLKTIIFATRPNWSLSF